jgi:probable HAF family extracellular repeat protein
MMKKSILLAVLSVFSFVAMAQDHRRTDFVPRSQAGFKAEYYAITDLGPISPVGVNLFGEVAGNLANGHAGVWLPDGGIRDLGVLPGGKMSAAAGINDFGVVAGTADGPGVLVSDWAPFSENCKDIGQPFLWTPDEGFAKPATIPLARYDPEYPCVQSDYAAGINVRGEVIGSNFDTETYKWAFLWRRPYGDHLIIAPLQDDAYQSSAHGINNEGTVVGQYGAWAELFVISHAVVWKDGVLTDIGSLGGDAADWSACSGANSINDAGEVAGWSSPAGVPRCDVIKEGHGSVHAFVWKAGGGMQDLGTLPGYTSSVAVKVNLNGEVIGTSGDKAGFGKGYDEYSVEVTGEPFLWTEAKGLHNLNDMIEPGSGWVLNRATDINVLGQIVGTGTKQGKVHGYMLTPQFADGN